MQRLLIGIIILNTGFGISQSNNIENWTENEKVHYSELKEIASYALLEEETKTSKDIFNKRTAANETLKFHFKKTIDSIGSEHFQAKPVRFYGDHTVYRPFDEERVKSKSANGKKIYSDDTNVFAYYRKEKPENPLGVILFEQESEESGPWIMIDKGQTKYFLIFDLKNTITKLNNL